MTVNLLTPERCQGRARQSARLARRQGAAVRPAARHHLGRPVQRAELRRDPDLQPGVHPRRRPGTGADGGVDGAHDEDHGAVGLLEVRMWSDGSDVEVRM